MFSLSKKLLFVAFFFNLQANPPPQWQLINHSLQYHFGRSFPFVMQQIHKCVCHSSQPHMSHNFSTNSMCFLCSLSQANHVVDASLQRSRSPTLCILIHTSHATTISLCIMFIYVAASLHLGPCCSSLILMLQPHFTLVSRISSPILMLQHLSIFCALSLWPHTAVFMLILCALLKSLLIFLYKFFLRNMNKSYTKHGPVM